MKFKGYVYMIFSGLVIIAAGLLIVLQWARAAQFSLFGYPYDIVAIDNQRFQGGANTALIILAAMAFGIITPWLVKTFFRGIGLLRKAGKAEKLADQAVRKAANQQKPAGTE